MGDRSKGPVILLVILLIVAAAAAFLGFIALQKEKEINATLTEENKELEVKKRSAEKQAADLKKQIEGLNQEIGQQKAKLQDYENKISEINNELVSEREAKESALSEVASIREASESARKDKAALETQLRSAQEELNSIRNQLTSLEGIKQELEQRLSSKPKEAEVKVPAKSAPKPEGDGAASNSRSHKVEEVKPGEVQLEKIVVAPNPQEEAPVVSSTVPLEGKVLVVNREYDFIVINLGQKDGVNLGDTFEVLRKDKSLGQAKVEEVRDTMSVATPGTKDMIKQIKEDDRVVRR